MLERSILYLPVEKVIERVGNAHKYQIRVLILFSAQWLISSIIFVAYNYLFKAPALICSKEGVEPFSCTPEQACSKEYKYEYDFKNGPNTLISEFGLVCDHEYFNSLGESTFFLGAVMGSIYYADIQIKKDRLFAIVQSLSLAAFVIICSAFSFNIWLSLGFLFLSNFGLFAYLNNSIIYFCEISSENLRLIGPNLFLLFWSFGRIVFSILIEYNLSWKSVLIWVTGVPLFITCLFFRFMKGSPRFEVVNHRFDEAKNAIRNMAKINNRGLPEFGFEYELKLRQLGKPNLQQSFANNNDDNSAIHKEFKKNHSFMTLFKYDSLKSSAWVLLLLRVIITIANHGNVLALNKFHDTRADNLLIDGIVEVFGYLFSCYVVLNVHRKNVFKTSCITIGTIYIIFSLASQKASDINVQQSSIMVVGLIFIARIAICAAMGNLFVYLIEVMPTSLRHFAFGLYSAAAYFVIIFTSSLVSTLREQNAHPQFILGVIFWACWYLMKYLEETYNKPLLNNIREEDVFLTNPIEMF